MAVQTMEDLFLHGLKDIYFAEKQILKALPKMAEAAQSSELRKAFQSHEEETKEQVNRLEQVFRNCDQEPQGENCPAIEGLIKEGEKIMGEVTDKEVLSAALLSDAQAVEHYEIARYGTLCAWAELLGYDDSLKLLKKTLDEEKKTDERLNQIALDGLNRRAAA